MPNIYDQFDSGSTAVAERNPYDDFDSLQKPTEEPVATTGEGLKNALERGWIALKNIPDTLALTSSAGLKDNAQARYNADRQMRERVMDALLEAGQSQDAQATAYAKAGPEALIEERQRALAKPLVKRMAESEALPRSEAQQRLASAEGAGAKFKAWATDPVELTASIILESLPPSLAGAAVGSLGGPPGMVAGVGLSSGLSTFSSELLSYAQQRGINIHDADAITKWLNSKEYSEDFNAAATKSAVVGVIDAATAGKAGSFISGALKQGVKKAAIGSAKEVALQAAGGAGGEALGSLAAGKPIDPFDVFVEAIAEVGSAPGEVVGNLRRSRASSIRRGSSLRDSISTDQKGGSNVRIESAGTEVQKTPQENVGLQKGTGGESAISETARASEAKKEVAPFSPGPPAVKQPVGEEPTRTAGVAQVGESPPAKPFVGKSIDGNWTADQRRTAAGKIALIAENPSGAQFIWDEQLGGTWARTADIAAYSDVQSKMAGLLKQGRGMGDPEFDALFAQNETIKNRHGGMPPVEPTNEALKIQEEAKPESDPAEYRVFLGDNKRPVWQKASSSVEAEQLVRAAYEQQYGPADFAFRADNEPIDFAPSKRAGERRTTTQVSKPAPNDTKVTESIVPETKPEGWSDERWSIFQKQRKAAVDANALRMDEFERVNAPEPTPKSPSEILSTAKYQLKGVGPQVHTLVSRLPASEVEIANGEQPVLVRNDKTGKEFQTTEDQLVPVQTATGTKRAKVDLDQELRTRKLDPSVFPTAKSKRAAIARHDAINKPGIKLSIEPEGKPLDESQWLKYGVTRDEQDTNLVKLLGEALAGRFEEEGYTRGGVRPSEQRRNETLLRSTGGGLGDFSRIFGKRIVFFDDFTSRATKPNGVVIGSAPNVIFIRRGAEKPHLIIFGHELTHEMQRQRPDLYAQLIDVIRSELRDTSDFRNQKLAQGYSESEILDEMAANILGDQLLEPAFLERLAQRNPTIFERVSKTIIDWLNKVIDVIKQHSFNSESYIKDIENVRDVLADIVARYASEGGEAQGSGSDVRLSVESERHGIQDTVEDRPVFTEVNRQQWRENTSRLFTESGLPLDEGAGNTQWVNNDFESNPEAKHLAEIVRRELQTTDPQGRLAVMDFLTVVRDNAVDQIARIRASQPHAWSMENATELYRLAQSVLSYTGQALAAIRRIPGAETILATAQKIDTVLTNEYDKMMSGDDGYILPVIRRVLEHFKDFFTDAEIKAATDAHPDLERIVTELEQAAKRDEGGIVYRLAHGRLKPKVAAKLNVLLRNARVQEAVQQIIEQAKRLGVQEKPSKTVPLKPGEKLLHLIEPETVSKIDEATRVAVRDAELAAGKKAAAKDPALSTEEKELIANGIVAPSPEHTEAGFSTPEFAPWRAIRHGLLGYSPVTDKLIEQVIRGDFKGTRFAKPGAPKPADTRIDLTALARQSDTEVQRVLDNHLANLQAAMDTTKATPETKRRILDKIKADVGIQLTARRKEFLDNFFDPTDKAPTTASQRLRALLNAGVSRDSRFQTDRVRQLIKRIDARYVNAEEVDSLATSTRQEKRNWINTKTDEILASEGLQPPSVDNATAEYVEAVTRTYLAERLQASEERIARSFLKGQDVVFTREQITPEARARSVEEAKTKLENLIRAGSFDTALVETVSRKSAVQRLVPTIPELVKKALATPAKNRAELADNFTQVLTDELGIDPAQADKAKAVFSRAFEQKFSEALTRAKKQVLEALSPKEKEVLEAKQKGRSLWQLVEQAVNTGALDDSAAMLEIVRKRGLKPPTPEQIASLKELVVREQRWREPTAAAIAKAGGDAAKLKIARDDAFYASEPERRLLHRQIESRMKEWLKPITWFGLHWFSDVPGVRKNTADAANEIIANNILARGLGIVRQVLDSVTMQVWYVPHNAIAYNSLRYGRNPSQYFSDLGELLGDALKIRIAAIRPAVIATQQAFKGKGLPERIEGLDHGVNFADRLRQKADELSRSDKQSDKVKAFLIRLYALQSIGGRAYAAIDVLQTNNAVWQEMAHQLKNAMRKAGKSPLEIETAFKDIFGDITTDLLTALEDAKTFLIANGETNPSDGQIKNTAWHLIRQRAYAKMALLELPADEFREKNKFYGQTIAWNKKAEGPGGWLFSPLHKIQEGFAEAGIPTGGLTAFSNAMATSMNRGLTWTGAGLFPDWFKGDPWYHSDVDRARRKMEAVTGLSVGGALATAAALGLFAVRLGWPRDDRERERWRAEGIKPYTVEIPLGDGNVISVPLRIGPLAPMAGMIAGGGAFRQLFEKRAKQQAAENERAKKLGVTPRQLPGPDAGDLLGVAMTTGWQMISGGRTAAGMLGAYSDMNTLSIKKAAASYVGSALPFNPAYQEMARAAGVEMNPKLASFWDLLVPLPTSEARRLNVLGDPVNEQSALERIISTTTLGLGVRSREAEDQAYRTLFASGYMPSSIQPNKAYNIGGTLRPMTRAELVDYTTKRGQFFKQELETMGYTDDPALAKAAYQRANQRALTSIGVTLPKRTTVLSRPTRRRTSRLRGGRSRRFRGFGRSRLRSRLGTRRRRLGVLR